MKRVLSLAMVVVLLLVTLAGVATMRQSSGATAAEPSAAEQVVSSADVPNAMAASAADVDAYWTPERMRNAKPYDVASRAGSPTSPKRAAGPQGVAGGVEPVNGSLPTGNVGESAGSEIAPGPSNVNNYTYPYPYTRLSIFTAYTHQKYRVSGKVFFVQDGSNYVCSGTLVNSPNKSMVMTAGHCVHGGGPGEGYHTNWTFVPAYKNNVRPYGTWAAQTLFTLTGWANNGDFSYDIGAAVLFPRASDNAKAVNLLGGRGMQWNKTRDQHFWSLGYPSGAPFNGQTLILCTASKATDDTSAGAGPAAIGIGCDMTPGSSGGGWVVGIGQGNGYVNGINSYKYTTSQPLAMYTPYFGAGAQAIYNAAGVWTP